MSYAYCADIWCDECGEQIKNDGRQPKLINTGDTDDYPQHCDDAAEADIPQHCAGCGVFLQNDLTCAGEDYVVETILDDLTNKLVGSVATTVWWPYYADLYDSIDERVGAGLRRKVNA